MLLNDVLTRRNVFTKLVLKDGDKELPKALKVKIMRIRIAYTKIQNQFDSDTHEFAQEIVPDELKDLINKENKTEEEIELFNKLNDKVSSEYQEFLTQKSMEEVSDIDDYLTEEEYSEILEVNAGNNVEINGINLKAADFLELVYEMFVK